MYVFTAAFRARDLALFVFCKSEDDLEGLLAIFAEELVARHGDPQSKLHEKILQHRKPGCGDDEKDAEPFWAAKAKPRAYVGREIRNQHKHPLSSGRAILGIHAGSISDAIQPHLVFMAMANAVPAAKNQTGAAEIHYARLQS